MPLNVLVLAAGIADPKWPLSKLEIANDGATVRDALPRILSPFDEAALEIALKLRDADPATRVAVALFDVSDSDALARSVGALRPDALRRIDARAVALWDAAGSASFFRDLLSADPTLDLVLIGREFGDLDDGVLPPCIAEKLGWRFAALIQQVSAMEGRLELMRERGRVRESFEIVPPMIASVTNDRKNRLRHPLLKNLMLAKRSTFPLEKLQTTHNDLQLTLRAAIPAPTKMRATACRLLDGPVEGQAAQLSDYLRAARAAK